MCVSYGRRGSSRRPQEHRAWTAAAWRRVSDVLRAHAEELGSIGRRVDGGLTGTDSLSQLEQGWSDAAYWFHEGLSEPLHTVAITKLETSMECLFRAESAKDSRRRIRRGLEVLLGMEDESEAQRIATQVVEARSRVLHGTWSTTRKRPTESVRRSRRSVTRFSLGSAQKQMPDLS